MKIGDGWDTAWADSYFQSTGNGWFLLYQAFPDISTQGPTYSFTGTVTVISATRGNRSITPSSVAITGVAKGTGLPNHFSMYDGSDWRGTLRMEMTYSGTYTDDAQIVHSISGTLTFLFVSKATGGSWVLVVGGAPTPYVSGPQMWTIGTGWDHSGDGGGIYKSSTGNGWLLVSEQGAPSTASLVNQSLAIISFSLNGVASTPSSLGITIANNTGLPCGLSMYSGQSWAGKVLFEIAYSGDYQDPIGDWYSVSNRITGNWAEVDSYGAWHLIGGYSTAHSFPWIGRFQMCRVKEVV